MNYARLDDKRGEYYRGLPKEMCRMTQVWVADAGNPLPQRGSPDAIVPRAVRCSYYKEIHSTMRHLAVPNGFTVPNLISIDQRVTSQARRNQVPAGGEKIATEEIENCCCASVIYAALVEGMEDRLMGASPKHLKVVGKRTAALNLPCIMVSCAERG